MLIGCCGWPEARARYFEHFPVVELQTTFYQPPSPELAEKWRSQAPPEFIFSLKAWQLITPRALQSHLPAAENPHPSFSTQRLWRLPPDCRSPRCLGAYARHRAGAARRRHRLPVPGQLSPERGKPEKPGDLLRLDRTRGQAAGLGAARGLGAGRSARPLPTPGPGALCRSLPYGTHLGTGGLFAPPRPRRLQLRLPVS